MDLFFDRMASSHPDAVIGALSGPQQAQIEQRMGQVRTWLWPLLPPGTLDVPYALHLVEEIARTLFGEDLLWTRFIRSLPGNYTKSGTHTNTSREREFLFRTFVRGELEAATRARLHRSLLPLLTIQAHLNASAPQGTPPGAGKKAVAPPRRDARILRP